MKLFVSKERKKEGGYIGRRKGGLLVSVWFKTHIDRTKGREGMNKMNGWF
jgi:hypothetical protein